MLPKANAVRKKEKKKEKRREGKKWKRKKNSKLRVYLRKKPQSSNTLRRKLREDCDGRRTVRYPVHNIIMCWDGLSSEGT